MLANIRKKISRKSSLKGQGLVEFALVIPILLALMVGIFEAGRAFWIYSAVTSASREAARYGSSASENDSGTPYYLDCTGIRSAATRLGSVAGISASDVVISYDNGPGTTSIGSCPVGEDDISLGDRVIVQVTGSFTPGAIVPLVQFPSFNISSMNRRTIIKSAPLPHITPPGTATP